MFYIQFCCYLPFLISFPNVSSWTKIWCYMYSWPMRNCFAHFSHRSIGSMQINTNMIKEFFYFFKIGNLFLGRFNYLDLIKIILYLKDFRTNYHFISFGKYSKRNSNDFTNEIFKFINLIVITWLQKKFTAKRIFIFERIIYWNLLCI